MKKINLYKQHDSMQCGIACLQMICSSLGKNYSAEELSHICYASAEGVSLLGISQAADTLGLHTICGRVKMEQLAQVQLPCILHWNQNHFVVLYDIKKKKKRNYLSHSRPRKRPAGVFPGRNDGTLGEYPFGR